jgi:hypothetical protein
MIGRRGLRPQRGFSSGTSALKGYPANLPMKCRTAEDPERMPAEKSPSVKLQDIALDSVVLNEQAHSYFLTFLLLLNSMTMVTPYYPLAGTAA